MQAIEMIVFFVAAIAISSMILLFIGNLKPEEIYGTIEKMIFPKPIDANSMMQAKKAEFVGKIGACWQQCGFGARNLNCGTFYITADGLGEDEKQLTKDYLKEMFEKYNYCNDCNAVIEGNAGDSIDLPAIVLLECTTSGLVIKQ